MDTNESKKEKEPEETIDWQAKAEEYLNGWKRAQADYQNREKEITKEKQALRGFFEESIVAEFLPVLDNLKTAIAECAISDIAHKDNWVKGIEHIVKQFEDVLNNFGVQRIDVLDKDFDPALCEAVDKAPSFAKASEGRDENKVIKIVADGYKKGDRVIRPARVIVG